MPDYPHQPSDMDIMQKQQAHRDPSVQHQTKAAIDNAAGYAGDGRVIATPRNMSATLQGSQAEPSVGEIGDRLEVILQRLNELMGRTANVEANLAGQTVLSQIDGRPREEQPSGALWRCRGLAISISDVLDLHQEQISHLEKL